MEDGPIIFVLIIGCICTPIGLALIGESSGFATIGKINLEMLAGIASLMLGAGCLVLGAMFLFAER